mmetsp:Transcript_31011/g.101100  ORF Transcript_31011/g.101100 Transcript_31011/m.101100 type:complete len:214 (-) Transcript_31011:59-700(-)
MLAQTANAAVQRVKLRTRHRALVQIEGHRLVAAARRGVDARKRRRAVRRPLRRVRNGSQVHHILHAHGDARLLLQLPRCHAREVAVLVDHARRQLQQARPPRRHASLRRQHHVAPPVAVQHHQHSDSMAAAKHDARDAPLPGIRRQMHVRLELDKANMLPEHVYRLDMHAVQHHVALQRVQPIVELATCHRTLHIHAFLACNWHHRVTPFEFC